MRKLLLVLLLVGLVSGVSHAWDRTFTAVVDCSTYPMTNDGWLNFSTDISSTPRGAKIRISRVAISNLDNAIAQTVTFYDNCTDTTNITVLWKVHLSSQTTSGVEFEFFTEKTPLIAENGLIIRKSDINSDVTVSVLYW